VRRFTRAPLIWVIGAVATAAAVLAISSATDEGGGPSTTRSVAPRSPPRAHVHHRAPQGPRNHGGGTHRQVHKAVAEAPTPRLDPAERQIGSVVRAYVAALNAHDGKRACALFVPRALATVRFPRDRGSCASSLSASVGYRD